MSSILRPDADDSHNLAFTNHGLALNCREEGCPEFTRCATTSGAGIRCVPLVAAPASPVPLHGFEQPDRDDPLGRPLLVHLVAVVVVVGQPPELLAFGAFGLTRA